MTNTNRNLSFSTSTPRRPALATRCTGPPSPGSVPDGRGLPEAASVVDVCIRVVEADPVAVVGTVHTPDTVPFALGVANAPPPVLVPVVVVVVVVVWARMAKSAEYTTASIGAVTENRSVLAIREHTHRIAAPHHSARCASDVHPDGRGKEERASERERPTTSTPPSPPPPAPSPNTSSASDPPVTPARRGTSVVCTHVCICTYQGRE